MNGSAETSSTGKTPFWKRSLQIGIPLVILLLGGGIVLERWLGERNLRKEQERSKNELTALEAKASKNCIDVQRRDIGLFALPLAWSVRKELMHGNYDQIDEYFSELIKIRDFRVFILVEPDGMIRVSTDRKLQGTAFSVLYPGMEIGVQRPVSYGLRDGSSLFVLPVMGLSGRLGTVAFVYSYQQNPLSGKASP
ncbi:MAG: hypothetical protein HGA62_06175 [Chlorobiaceae bacterium]|nr:hypothetical protein [Chlorobiaceae bacterium]NTV60811.1 hypothetical protein [Chlorobiaceae bacterium]